VADVLGVHEGSRICSARLMRFGDVEARSRDSATGNSATAQPLLQQGASRWVSVTVHKRRRWFGVGSAQTANGSRREERDYSLPSRPPTAITDRDRSSVNP